MIMMIYGGGGGAVYEPARQPSHMHIEAKRIFIYFCISLPNRHILRFVRVCFVEEVFNILKDGKLNLENLSRSKLAINDRSYLFNFPIACIFFIEPTRKNMK